MLVEVRGGEQQLAPSRAVFVRVLDSDAFEPEMRGDDGLGAYVASN